MNYYDERGREHGYWEFIGNPYNKMGVFKHGLKDGLWITKFNINNKIREKIIYKDDIVINFVSYTYHYGKNSLFNLKSELGEIRYLLNSGGYTFKRIHQEEYIN